MISNAEEAVPAIQLSGTVCYANMQPVQQASVTILDLDTQHSGNNLILATTTDSEGRFTGLSEAWGKHNKAFSDSRPDATILRFEPRQRDRRHGGPVAPVSPSLSVRIVLPWLPMPVLAVLDGLECKNSADLTLAVLAEFDPRRKVKIIVKDSTAVAALALLEDVVPSTRFGDHEDATHT